MKKTRIVISCAMLAAISFAIGWICKTYMTFGAIRITFENIPIIIAGIAFGPVCGGAVGAVADLLSCVSSGYSVNPIITIGSAAVGITAGLVSHYIVKKGKLQIFTSVMAAHIIGSMIVKSFGLYIMGYALGIILCRIPLYMCIGIVEFYLIYMLLKNKSIQNEINRLKR
ncbi:MAG: folate family ECF transporter S component [Clostridia bacterium]|nr:folate family ECF transporter S component [Clostridia bacterium]